jgi:hypothetical protein
MEHLKRAANRNLATAPATFGGPADQSEIVESRSCLETSASMKALKKMPIVTGTTGIVRFNRGNLVR